MFFACNAFSPFVTDLKTNSTIHFLFESQRKGIFTTGNSNYQNMTAAYGYPQLRQMGFNCSFTDSGFKDPLSKAIHVFLGTITKAVFGVRIPFRQVISWGRYIPNADILFATAHKSAMPLLLLKFMGLMPKPILVASIGLPEYVQARDKRSRVFLSKLFQVADKIVCYGFHEPFQIHSVLGLPMTRLQFIPFGVDTDFFTPNYPRVNDDNSAILSIGADSQRDYPSLFEAASDLPDVQFDVITCPNNVVNLPIPTNVSLHFGVPFMHLKKYYDRALFVVLPVRENSYTGATTCLLQAMSMAKAVIVSSTRAIIEGYGLIDQENCLLVNPGDWVQLKNAILHLCNHPDHRMAIGESARRHVCNNLSWLQYVNRLAGLISELAT